MAKTKNIRASRGNGKRKSLLSRFSVRISIGRLKPGKRRQQTKSLTSITDQNLGSANVEVSMNNINVGVPNSAKISNTSNNISPMSSMESSSASSTSMKEMEDRPIVDEREIRVPVSETKVQAEVEQESMGIAVNETSSVSSEVGLDFVLRNQDVETTADKKIEVSTRMLKLDRRISLSPSPDKGNTNIPDLKTESNGKIVQDHGIAPIEVSANDSPPSTETETEARLVDAQIQEKQVLDVSNATSTGEDGNGILHDGSAIKVVKGKYAGQTGYISKVTEKMYLIDFGQEQRRLMHSSVIPTIGDQAQNIDPLLVNHEEYMPQSQTRERQVEPSASLRGQKEWLNRKRTRNSLCIEGKDSGGLSFAGRFVSMMSVTSAEEPKNDSFLSYMFGQRVLVINKLIDRNLEQMDLPVTDQRAEGTYELISSKVVSGDKDCGITYQYITKSMNLQSFYIQTKGQGLKDIDLEKFLSSLGNFSKLETGKRLARYELLHSPAYKLRGDYLIKEFHASIFADISEEGHVGCGFICEDMLVDLLGGSRYKIARKTTCIQVRAFIPSMGIYKGMLTKKKIVGGPKVLLPASMKKVEASLDKERNENGCLLVCQGGVDPSKTNSYVERLPDVNPNLKIPPKKSFKIKKLGDMIHRILFTLKVPEDVIHSYALKSSKWNSRTKEGEKLNKNDPRTAPKISHAYLRGVIDATGKIPSNYIYLPGFKKEGTLGERVFITRCPCMKETDGRLIRVLTQRPYSMSIADFQWLESKPFGTVIFGLPRKGMASSPELIADGNLDGDR